MLTDRSPGTAPDKRIPLLNLRSQYASIREEIQAAINDVLESGIFVGGPKVAQFEEEFARYCGTRYAVAVSSGTDALRFALLAMGVGPGHEVVTVAHTFIATLEAISQTGAEPILVDIRPDTYTIDVHQAEKAITKRTRAIIPVHLYGQPADMGPLLELSRRYGLAIIEDACQAHGAKYQGARVGSLGLAGCFSFYPAKNLGAYGEGGAVTTNNSQVAQNVRMLRDHGQSQKYVHEIPGYNGRLEALQCAILLVKLRYLDAWNQARRQKARLYAKLLAPCKKVGLPQEMPEGEHVHHLYVVRVENREFIQRRLLEAGIETGLHYPIPSHRQKAYAGRSFSFASYPVTEQCAQTLLSLPMFPEIKDGEVAFVADTLREAIEEPR